MAEGAGAGGDNAAVVVALTPRVPGRDGGRSLRWSPYGHKLPLTVGPDGRMATKLILGSEGTPPIDLELAKSDGARHFDRLFVDFDRNGRFDAGEVLETTPSEQRHKYWSTFDTVVSVPVHDPVTGKASDNPYALSFWYVEDPASPGEPPVLRFSRRGWMEGKTILDGVEAEVLVTENAMDGVFDTLDSWSLAPSDSADEVLGYQTARPLSEYNWLLERAYKVRRIDPSGRRIAIVPFDPGMTRTEEIAMNDNMRVDREAARSGGSVTFLEDYTRARATAHKEGKPLFIDFETTWCGPCKLMDQWVYTADAVVNASRAVVAVKVDGDDHPDLAKGHSVIGYPTMILLGPDGTEIRRLEGYRSVAEMAGFLAPAAKSAVAGG
jgi:thiol-disulfide isomerase/thioredoxin